MTHPKRAAGRNRQRNHHRKGGIIPILIIVVVIFVAVFVINMIQKDPTGHVNEFPWTEEHRLVSDIEAIQLPAGDQFKLDADKTIDRSIQYEGADRGRLNIEITTDGAVHANWKASYQEGNFEKDVDAGFEGNVDATMVYEDENSSDAAKLFFIAKGNFLLKAFKKNGGAQAGGGDAYVVGWIDPDGEATGTMVLAPDKKKTKIYTW